MQLITSLLGFIVLLTLVTLGTFRLIASLIGGFHYWNHHSMKDGKWKCESSELEHDHD